MFPSCLRINGTEHSHTTLLWRRISNCCTGDAPFNKGQVSDTNCQQLLSAQGNPLIHCGGNNGCLKDIITTHTAYSTFPHHYAFEQAEIQLFQMCVSLVSALGTIPKCWASLLSPCPWEYKEIQRKHPSHWSALWEDSRSRWYLYTQVLCTKYKHTNGTLNSVQRLLNHHLLTCTD